MSTKSRISSAPNATSRVAASQQSCCSLGGTDVLIRALPTTSTIVRGPGWGGFSYAVNFHPEAAGRNVLRPFLLRRDPARLSQAKALDGFVDVKRYIRSPLNMRGEVRLHLSVTWFRPASRVYFDFSSLHAIECMFSRWNLPVRVLGQEGNRKHAVTLGMRCCHLPWPGSGRGSRRALRTASPRLLFRCPILRRQILGVCRRDVGEKPWGHRSRDRGGPALPQGRASPNRPGRALDDAVTFRLN